MEKIFSCELSDKKDLFIDLLNAFVLEKMETFEHLSNDEADSSDDDQHDNDSNSSTSSDDDDDNDECENKKEKNRGGFQALMQLSTELSNFFGGEVSMARTQVMNFYFMIKYNLNLQKVVSHFKLFKRNNILMFFFCSFVKLQIQSIKLKLSSVSI